MRISDWSSDVCSSDLFAVLSAVSARPLRAPWVELKYSRTVRPSLKFEMIGGSMISPLGLAISPRMPASRSEEHTSELQSLMRISYAVFCLKKTKNTETASQRVQKKKTNKNHNRTERLEYILLTTYY